MHSEVRLHMPAVPHALMSAKGSSCAFQTKVRNFPKMMCPLGFEVFVYGVEGMELEAGRAVEIMPKETWETLRVASCLHLKLAATREEAEAFVKDETKPVGALANWDTPLYREFNDRFREALMRNYRGATSDIVCLPFGKAHDLALAGLNDYLLVESGIGYPDVTKRWRIFESYAWLHTVTGLQNGQFGDNYHFVVPNYYVPAEWPLSLEPKIDTVGFLGRICAEKGIAEICALARQNQHVRFFICGQGDPKPWLHPDMNPHGNVIYHPPISGAERGAFYGQCICSMSMTKFIEPFCGSAVEAQLCGTPVICPDYGAFTETVEHTRTGMRCRTLADMQIGLELARRGHFDRSYIRERAVRLYALENVAPRYAYAFHNILNVIRGPGWNAAESYLSLLNPELPPLDDERKAEACADSALCPDCHCPVTKVVGTTDHSVGLPAPLAEVGQAAQCSEAPEDLQVPDGAGGASPGETCVVREC